MARKFINTRNIRKKSTKYKILYLNYTKQTKEKLKH